MSDAMFDGSRDRRLLWAARVIGVIAVSALASRADAQIPGAPVLQNAWATPGVSAAVNFAGSSGQSVIAAAAAWSRSSGRFQISGGIGYQNRSDFDGRVVYGGRVAIPFGSPSDAFGLAAFAGIGGGPAGQREFAVNTVTGARIMVDDTLSSTLQVPLGASVGYRLALGSHGLTVYAAPAWVIYSGGETTDGLFRAAIGADFGITRSLGATAGFDFGGNRSKDVGGPSSAQFGVGVSYAFGRR